jgi:hypothetical protein
VPMFISDQGPELFVKASASRNSEQLAELETKHYLRTRSRALSQAKRLKES